MPIRPCAPAPRRPATDVGQPHPPLATVIQTPSPENAAEQPVGVFDPDRPDRLSILRRAAGSLLAAALALLAASPARADGTEIGSVSTTFRFLGANDRIVVDRYDDPKVQGVSCYLSHAATGGISGSFGLATDPSRFSLACRATGPVTVQGKLPDNEIAFGQSQSLFFKELRVSRLVDRDRNVLVYLAWSTKSLSKGGSPYNAITVVPLDRP